ncbi:hypothetical protein QG37_03526 [Candidozyma auris]|uniref:Uncharacterized protein n=1 Tax=Candidozyma auris TaxID=498019 RepID=A0A0L0NZ03_CANAR|nr:hypothetical protein QG37_03526 [[Candida] auris]
MVPAVADNAYRGHPDDEGGGKAKKRLFRLN